MSKVISIAGRRAGHPVHMSTPTPATSPAHDHQDVTIGRHQAIENALSLALYWIRQDASPSNIHAATVRAVRAAAMLKQACKDVGEAGRAGQ